MTVQTQSGCMRLWANRISSSALERRRGREAGRLGGPGVEGEGAEGRRYLRCWCCCCGYFAGYQHGLVSMLCVWLHPESREGRGGTREKTKRKRNRWKGEKRNVQVARDITSGLPAGPHHPKAQRNSGRAEEGQKSILSFAKNPTNAQARKPMHPFRPAGFHTWLLKTVHKAGLFPGGWEHLLKELRGWSP